LDEGWVAKWLGGHSSAYAGVSVKRVQKHAQQTGSKRAHGLASIVKSEEQDFRILVQQTLSEY